MFTLLWEPCGRCVCVCVHNLEVHRGMLPCPPASISEGFYSWLPPTVFSPISWAISPAEEVCPGLTRHLSPHQVELCPLPGTARPCWHPDPNTKTILLSGQEANKLETLFYLRDAMSINSVGYLRGVGVQLGLLGCGAGIKGRREGWMGETNGIKDKVLRKLRKVARSRRHCHQ